MNGNLVEVRVVLLALETLRGVLLVLGGDVTRHSRYTAFFLLSALEDDLHPVSFCFLCHNSENLNKVNQSFLLCVAKSSLEAVLLDDPHTLAGYLEGDVPLLLLTPETLVLEIEGEIALGAQLGMGNIVAFHSLSSGDLTNFCHDLSFLIIFYKNFRNLSHLMLEGKLCPAFVESHMTDGLPTMWSSGTNPQYLESRELCLLSPIIK